VKAGPPFHCPLVHRGVQLEDRREPFERPRLRYDSRAMGKRTPAPIAERLQAVLERIDRPGTFCVWGALGAVLPGLEVEGMGSIGLPLTAAQARALRRRCEQAPYGKGTQTLVDTRVRRVWRLAPSRFALTNPAWPEFLGVAVARVQAELGLERQRLTAHLHDLLLYEEGCFFKAHRDGEKRDRMVATLVITLPAVHGGGELVVRHEGQEQIVDFSRPEGRHQIQFAAFYADCEHEVKPLRSGHRLCLVYNLALAKSRAPLGPP
jgi:predicted 2-oxoglutarate/Fe(II)-dependent dioxygenase YbiX